MREKKIGIARNERLKSERKRTFADEAGRVRGVVRWRCVEMLRGLSGRFVKPVEFVLRIKE